MGSEEFYLSRVEPPNWYEAPSNIQIEGEATCKICGEPILPGQIITDWEEEYFHEDCFDAHAQDELEDV